MRGRERDEEKLIQRRLSYSRFDSTLLIDKMDDQHQQRASADNFALLKRA